MIVRCAAHLEPWGRATPLLCVSCVLLGNPECQNKSFVTKALQWVSVTRTLSNASPTHSPSPRLPPGLALHRALLAQFSPSSWTGVSASLRQAGTDKASY